MRFILSLLLTIIISFGLTHNNNIVPKKDEMDKANSPTQVPTPTPCYPGEDLNTQIRQVLQGSCVTATPATPTPYAYPTYEPATKQYYYDPTPTPYAYEQPTIETPKNRSCYQSGDYTYCNDGSSYITSGNSTFINGGANGKSGSCITSGSYTNCSDGSSGIQNGNFGSYYGNGGSGTCIKNGAWTNCSDGSTTYNSGY